jgi:ABC-2 type transport system permease protein
MAFDYLGSNDNDNKIFDIKYGTLDEMKTYLDDEEISGYIYLNDTSHVVIKNNGFNQSIIKYVVEEINMVSNGIKSIDFSSIEEIGKYANSLMNSEVKIKDTSNKNMSMTMIEFYSLIAMTCLYGASLSMYSLNQILPNMSNKGKRVGISPVSKFKLIISSLSASFVAQVLGVLILFLYTIFVLNVDYGNNLLLVLLLSLVGSFAGLSLGIFISSVLKKDENAKTGIIIAYTMLCSFFAGMMGITMKYIIDTNAPIINLINPVNMITDGLYALYYYNTLDRYIFNIISLLIFSLVLIIISFMFFRRQKYDSI